MADIKNVSASLKVLACGTSVPSGATVTVEVFDADHPVQAGWIAEGQIEVTGDKPAKSSKKAAADKAAADKATTDKAAADKAAADKAAADKAAAEDVLAKAQADYDAGEKAVLAEGSGTDEATAFEAAEKALEAAKSALSALSAQPLSGKPLAGALE